jgi:hypothetical protein
MLTSHSPATPILVQGRYMRSCDTNHIYYVRLDEDQEYRSDGVISVHYGLVIYGVRTMDNLRTTGRCSGQSVTDRLTES